MVQNPLISVIVPVYNVEDYLHRCVESILNQTYPHLEIILVDDGAKDNSGAICDEYALRDNRVRVIHQENGGQSKARNAGLDAATGEYIAFVDSDDYLAEDAYEAMLAMALREQVKLISAGRFDVSSRTGKVEAGLCPKCTEVISMEQMLGRMFTWNGCDCSPCDKLYHRELFRTVRFPSFRGNEDTAVLYRIVEQTDRVGMLDKPIYYYFHRPGSTSNEGLSPMTFHFHQGTEKIYPYIAETYPAVKNEVRYFRVRSLIYTLQSLDLATEADRNRYLDVYKEQKRNLREHLWFILTSPLFGRKERITHLLIGLGLYRPLRKFLTRNK